MNNIKKIAFYSIFSFSILKNSCGNEHLHERASKILAYGGIRMAQKFGVDATKIAVDGLLDATKITTQAALEAANVTSDLGVKVSENAIKASEGFGVEASKVWAPVVGAAVVIYGVSAVGDMGARLYAYHNPSEEQKARENKAREINEYIDARRAHRTCLKDNMRAHKDASGLPVACKDTADAFVTAAGSRAEFEEMSEAFKSLFR